MRALIRGGGDLASAVAHLLYTCGFDVLIVELKAPKVIRRSVAFASVITDGQTAVEGVGAKLLNDLTSIAAHHKADYVAVTTLPEQTVISAYQPDIFIDATLSKKPVDYRIGDAPLIIGLGPAITAGHNADVVIETQRGHDLGRLIYRGQAAANTGIPGMVAGESAKRVHYSPQAGKLVAIKDIGDSVTAGTTIAMIAQTPIIAKLDGVVRGMLATGSYVDGNVKIADVDPRGIKHYCQTISDKGRTIAGSVLAAIIQRFYNENKQ